MSPWQQNKNDVIFLSNDPRSACETLRNSNLQRCECKVISRKSSRRPVWCPACLPQSGTPWYGWGSCPWFLLPVKTSSRVPSFSAAVTITLALTQKKQLYLHGLVKPLCKVGGGVPDAFHWGQRRKEERRLKTSSHFSHWALYPFWDRGEGVGTSPCYQKHLPCFVLTGIWTLRFSAQSPAELPTTLKYNVWNNIHRAGCQKTFFPPIMGKKK